MRTARSFLRVSCVVFVALGAAWGQPALILKDIHPGPAGSSPRVRGPDSTPFSVASLGQLFFVRDDGTSGHQVWVSDGSWSGTKRVSDLETACFSVDFNQKLCFPRELTAGSGGRVFFISRGPSDAGASLWKTDGTAANTKRVKADLWPGQVTQTFHGGLTDVKGTLFFAAPPPGAVGEETNELWKSDGTESGTVLLKDIRPGAAGSGPQWLTAAGSRLFFFADDGTHGCELWMSDGTAASTQLVKDIRSGTEGSCSFRAVNLGGRIIFPADDGVHGLEPWTSDGTRDGTLILQDINPVGRSRPLGFAHFGGAVYFSAEDESGVPGLWRTDGTPTGTKLVKAFPAATVDSFSNLTAVGDRLFFTVYSTTGLSSQLWRSDGTAPGTVELYEDLPRSWRADQLTDVSGRLFFTATMLAPASLTDDGLWTSDGSTEGTHFVQGWDYSGFCPIPADLVAVRGTLFFNVPDDLHGDEPWVLPLSVPCGGDIIVDNSGPGTSFTGSWKLSGAPLFFGKDSLWAKATSTTVPTYTFELGNVPSGSPVSYEVFEWHSAFSSRTRAARHVIVHDGGTANLLVDQSIDGGWWNPLGMYTFTGKVPRVRIHAEDLEKSTNADAILFRQVVECPLAVIDSIEPNPATAGVDEVCFLGHGASGAGITAYEWTSSNQPGVLLSSASGFCASNLIPGTHSIALRVKDGAGRLSLPAFATLVVNENPAVCDLEVIVDNGGPGTSFKGSWSPSQAPGFFGTGSVYTKKSATSTVTVSYSFEAEPPPGTYEVFEWHTNWPTRTDFAQHHIEVNGVVISSRIVDQSTNGAQWNSLGLYELPGGGRCKVTIFATDTQRSTNADAMRFLCRSTGG